MTEACVDHSPFYFADVHWFDASFPGKGFPKFFYGTGVAVKSDLILTCYHVVEKAKKILIRGVYGRFDTTYLAKINFYEPELDIAILSIENYKSNKCDQF